jgi:type I restriction enzyme S subunit
MNTGPFGSSVHKSDYTDDGCPIVNPADIVGNRITVGKRVSTAAAGRLTRYKLNEGDVVIGRRGEMGRIAVVDAKSVGYLCGTGCFFVRMNERALPGFWKHFFCTDYAKDYLDAHAVGGTMKNLNLSILGGMPVPVPPLKEQELVVDILDKFDALINDISQGLPAEIEARRRQYAYYRDKLLAFSERVS